MLRDFLEYTAERAFIVERLLSRNDAYGALMVCELEHKYPEFLTGATDANNKSA